MAFDGVYTCEAPILGPIASWATSSTWSNAASTRSVGSLHVGKATRSQARNAVRPGSCFPRTTLQDGEATLWEYSAPVCWRQVARQEPQLRCFPRPSRLQQRLFGKALRLGVPALQLLVSSTPYFRATGAHCSSSCSRHGTVGFPATGHYADHRRRAPQASRCSARRTGLVKIRSGNWP